MTGHHQVKFKTAVPFPVLMTRRSFAGLLVVEALLAFGNTFAGSFNMIYLFKERHMPIWSGATYLAIGFAVSIGVSLWLSWRPKVDLMKLIVFSLACLVAEYVLFLVVRDGWLLSVLVGFAFGLYYSLVWTPTNIWMAQETDKSDRGLKYGAVFFLWPLATFVAPFLGGLVIGLTSYSVLYIMGIGIIIATAVTVYLARGSIPRDQPMKINLPGFGLRNSVAVYAEGAFEGVFWADITIISFMFLTDEMELGALWSLFGLSAGLMGIILGKISDRIQDRVSFLRISSIATIPCIVLVYLATSLNSFGVAAGMLEFAAFVMPVFMFAIMTDTLEDRKNDSVLTREFLLDIGRVTTIPVLMALLYLGFTPQECFLLAIPFLGLTLLAREKKKASAA